MKSVQLIDLPKISDPRGNLSFIEAGTVLPFVIERIFWTYDVPGGNIRGGHAYKKQQELILALSGSFDVVIEMSNGEKKVFHMNRSYFGLYIPPMVWRHMENFSTNAVSLHLSDSTYDANDYIRNKKEFTL